VRMEPGALPGSGLRMDWQLMAVATSMWEIIATARSGR